MKKSLRILFVIPLGVFAQPQGPLLQRFPYVPESREASAFDLGRMMSELSPSIFGPQDYNLPDHLLFSESELKWVESIREGFRLLQAGAFENAKEIFAAFLEEFPDHVPSRIALADILYSIGDHASAEEAYLSLLQEHPNHFQALNNLAWMYSTSSEAGVRRPDQARELVRRAMMVAPQSHHVWSTLSQTLFAQSRFAEAAQAAATAVNLAQRSGVGTEVLVNYLMQLDRSRAAIEATSLMN